jgi:hypothetical protein
MAMNPWWKAVTPRREVREGRSFNPAEFAIALEQVVSGTAPVDYRDPAQFFDRNVFTRALQEHVGMVLRRLTGETADTAPVLTLITQFGGGKTHTLTALYHLASLGRDAEPLRGVKAVLETARVPSVPKAKVAVFVGNAWDPREGRETPWIDIASQLAGAEGVAALGTSAETTPPGTEAIGRLIQAAGGTVLILLDEVLNFLNRHRSMADAFHSFVQNLTVAATGTPKCVVVISLPRSQVEMTDRDLEWQERITKVVRRVAKDLIANDESEISEVIRRRLFEDLGDEAERKRVATAFADWCFERRAQLPPEWTAASTAGNERTARDYLRERFERCYPFHPATLSVFQRKWQALPQYQQTRGTLAMLAQWVSKAYREGFTTARTEPLIALGSAPLEALDFRSVVLGQLGESRLVAAIDYDIAGGHSHASALDVDSRDQLRDIHRRVATVILFESSGGQADKTAHLPELRFALGEPGIDTTSIDNAAVALDRQSFFIRKVGTDGFRIGYKPKLTKVVSDRRASLDEEIDIKPEVRRVVESEFQRGSTLPVIGFPSDSSDIPDSPRLSLVVGDPEWEWSSRGNVSETITEWTKRRGTADRLYPGAIVWCLRRPGRDLREKVELVLAWRRVRKEVDEGTLGTEFDKADLAEIREKVVAADNDAKDEVWAQYRYVLLTDPSSQEALRVIDLGAGHSSANETLCQRVLQALKQEALVNESFGAGYLERKWPPALEESGEWPLSGLRQAFVNGTLTRLIDPETALRTKISDLVDRGELGLASRKKPDGSYERIWFRESVPTDEIAFESDIYLLKSKTAQQLLLRAEEPSGDVSETDEEAPQHGADEGQKAAEEDVSGVRQLRVVGVIAPEVWNRFGTHVIPRLRTGDQLQLHLDISLEVDSQTAKQLEAGLRQALEDLKLGDSFRFE